MKPVTILTPQQVIDQKNRFDKFIETADLIRIGEKYIEFESENRKLNNYRQIIYIRRILKTCAKVYPMMFYPNTMDFYSDVLTRKAIDAYYHTIIKKYFK